MHCLILGARSPVALEWCRILKSMDCTITVADSVRWPISRWTQFKDHYLSLPSPRFAFAEWRLQLLEYVRTHCVDWLMPNAEEAFYVSFIKEELSRYCKVWTADFSLMRSLHHKYDFTEMVQQLSITAPQTWLFDKDCRVLPLSSSELVFKPVFSRFANATIIAPNEVQRSSMDATVKWVMQTYVKGTEYCSYSIFDEGRLIAHTAYQPTYRAGKGAGYYCIPFQNEAIERFVREFGEKYCYTGQVGFDFIQDECGKFWVLECNPRGTSGLHLFAYLRSDLLNCMKQLDHSVLVASPDKALAFKFALCAMGLPKQLGQLELGKWWQDYRHSDDIVYHDQDLKPALLQSLPTLEMLYIAVKHRLSIWSATTHDIEWNGEAIK